MALRDRIGVDIGRRLRLEEAVQWAAAQDVQYIDIQLDTAANALTALDDARTSGIRRSCENLGIHLGLHTRRMDSRRFQNVADHTRQRIDRIPPGAPLCEL